MKKVFSFIMVAIMLIALCSFSAAATTEIESSTTDEPENSAVI